MELDHLIEHVKTANGYETRVLGPEEIQPRCVEAGTKLIAQTKNKELAMGIVTATKRLSAPVLALDPIGALVDLGLAACNEMEVYEVLMRPLSQGFEADKPKAKSTAIIKRCLKDKDFKKDFLDEKDSGDERRAANACKILLDEKLVKSCKGGK
jgi:hypothetical protein